MGTSNPVTLRTNAARRLLEAVIPNIAADAARARENSEVLRQELMPETIPPAEPGPA